MKKLSSQGAKVIRSWGRDPGRSLARQIAQNLIDKETEKQLDQDRPVVVPNRALKRRFGKPSPSARIADAQKAEASLYTHVRVIGFTDDGKRWVDFGRCKLHQGLPMATHKEPTVRDIPSWHKERDA